MAMPVGAEPAAPTQPAEVPASLCLHIFVAGKVQNVHYRNYTKRQADVLGLVGWVRNLPDGRVEMKAEGPPEKVQALRQWCHKGSPASRVTAVLATPCPPEGFATFEVDRKAVASSSCPARV